MDLGGYVNIEKLEHILSDNSIDVPRLRGLRLMSEEEKLSKEDMNKLAKNIGMIECEDACRSNFIFDANWSELSGRTDRIVNKYMRYKSPDDKWPEDIKWNKVKGYRRKIFKYRLRKAKERVANQYGVWNKYCGQKDVLYIHARIGGDNWSYYDGDKLMKEPWFIEKVDDAFDGTYCDIYAKIKEIDLDDKTEECF